MNTIYRLIWNKTLRQLVVASELARPQARGNKFTKKRISALCAALLGVAITPLAIHAATTVTNPGGTFSSYSTTLLDYTIINESSLAASANGGGTYFTGSADAGNAIITNQNGTGSGYNGGFTYFQDVARAGTANITNVGSAFSTARAGLVEFHGDASADNATITNQGGTNTDGQGGMVTFYDLSTAGSATITNQGGTLATGAQGGSTTFSSNSTADHANITNNAAAFAGAKGGQTTFNSTLATDHATADQATITNMGGDGTGVEGGHTNFLGYSTAGNATLTAHGGTNGGGGGSISFAGDATGNTAKILLDGNGLLDISTSAVSTHTITIGSLATVSNQSGGQVTLGSNTLSVGGDNTSTTFSGSIHGSNGALTKVGSGTLTLSGANDYTGATTVSSGTLALAHANALTSNVTVNNGATLAADGVTAGLTGNVTNAGILRVGITGNNSSNALAGTLNISGNYTQTTDGLLEIGAWNNTSGYGKVNVSGTASLPTSAKIKVDVNTFTTLTNGQTLAGVLSAGTLSWDGTAAMSKSADNSWLFDFVATKNVNSVDLHVVAAGGSGGNVWTWSNTTNERQSTAADGSISNTATQPVAQFKDGLTDLADGNGGAASFVKNGSGTLTLDQANTFTGPTTVNSGTLALANANALASNVTVNSGGTLAADGVTAGLTGNVTNAGTLRVGVLGSDAATASAGTLNINGNYTQTTDGLLQIGAWNNTTGYGKVHVTGTASLPDSAKIAVEVKNFNSLTNGQTLAGVLTAGTLSWTGNAAMSKIADSSWLYDFTASKNGNQVDLNVVPASSGGSGGSGGDDTGSGGSGGSGSGGSGSSNGDTGSGGNTVVRAVQLSGLQVVAGGVAPVLDGMVQNTNISGDAANVVTALGKLPDAQSVAKAAAQTTPHGQTGLSALRLVTMHIIGQSLQDRLDSQRGLSSGDNIYTDGHAWMRLAGSWTNQDDNDGVPGFDANTGVLTAGSDAEFGRNLRLGVAFSYANTNVDGNTEITGTAQDADINSYFLSIYGTYALAERTSLDFSVDGGFNHNDADRHINFGGLARTAEGSYTTSVAHAGAGIKQIFTPTKALTLAPFTRLDYTWLRDGSYDESGADALNLHVQSNTVEALVLSAGSQLAYTVNEKASLTAEAGIGYDAINDQPAITSTMTGAQGIAFTTKGSDPSAWRLGGGLGLSYKVNKDIVLSGNYDVLYNDTLLNQTVSAKLRWSF